MNIIINVDRVIGANGRAQSYIPEVHYEIDDMDYVDMDEMNILKNKHSIRQINLLHLLFLTVK